MGDERLAPSVAGVAATPAAASSPALWLLSSSGYSALGAGALGLSLVQVTHFAGGGDGALELYCSSSVLFPSLTVPWGLVTASVQAAETADEARYQAAPMQLAVRRLWSAGTLDLIMAPEAAAVLPPSSGLVFSRGPDGVQQVGTGAEVLAGLTALADRVGADELMVTTAADDPVAGVHTSELLVEASREVAHRLAA